MNSYKNRSFVLMRKNIKFLSVCDKYLSEKTPICLEVCSFLSINQVYKKTYRSLQIVHGQTKLRMWANKTC